MSLAVLLKSIAITPFHFFHTWGRSIRAVSDGLSDLVSEVEIKGGGIPVHITGSLCVQSVISGKLLITSTPAIFLYRTNACSPCFTCATFIIRRLQ